jgi:hypothetical protein
MEVTKNIFTNILISATRFVVASKYIIYSALFSAATVSCFSLWNIYRKKIFKHAKKQKNSLKNNRFGGTGFISIGMRSFNRFHYGNYNQFSKWRNFDMSKKFYEVNKKLQFKQFKGEHLLMGVASKMYMMIWKLRVIY